MRNLKIVMIAVWVIVALLIAAIIVGGIFFRQNKDITIIGSADGPTSIIVARDNKNLVLDETASASDLEKINLDITTDHVSLFPSEDENIRVRQFGVNLEDDRIVKIDKNGGALSIHHPPQSGFHFFSFPFFSRQESYVELYLPENYQASLRLDLTSGDVQIATALNLDQFEVDITSGNITGDMDITAKNSSLKLTSGNLNLSGLFTQEFTIDTTSGKMLLGSLSGSGTLKSTSGDIDIVKYEPGDQFQAKITSGNVFVGFAGERGIKFEGERTSGTISTWFDVQSEDDNNHKVYANVGEEPYCDISVSLTSGSFHLFQAE